MARLNRTNLEAVNGVVPRSIRPSSSRTPSQKVMPPPQLPSTTPKRQSMGSVDGVGSVSSSGKKKRRRRGGKNRGRDSLSENATTMSKDVSKPDEAENNMQPPEERGVGQPNMKGLEQLSKVISAEESTVFAKEPEMFGVYESASDSDHEHQDHKEESKRDQRKRLQTYSPDISETSHEDEDESGTNSHAPEVVSGSQEASAPTPRKNSNGRYTCPFKDKHDCDTTFADKKGARRHGDAHISIDKFKCELCNKAFSRKDTCDAHKKTHGTIKKGQKGKKADSSMAEDLKNKPRVTNGATNALTDGDVDTTEAEIHHDANSKCEHVAGASRKTLENHKPVASTEAKSESEPELDNKRATSHEARTDPTSEHAEVCDSDSSSPTPTVEIEASHPQPVSATPPQANGSKRKRPQAAVRQPNTNGMKQRKRRRVDNTTGVTQSDHEETGIQSSKPALTSTSVSALSIDDSSNAVSSIEEDAAESRNGSKSLKQVSSSRRSSHEVETIGKPACPASQEHETSLEQPDAVEPESVKTVEKKSKNTRTRPTRAISRSTAVVARQSSMDDFVQRENVESENARASSSRSQSVQVKMSVRAKEESKTQKLLFSKQKQNELKSTKGRDKARAKLKDDESDQGTQEAQSSSEARTNSTDKSQPASTARNASSTGTKAKSKKRKSKIGARLQASSSSSEAENEAEEEKPFKRQKTAKISVKSEREPAPREGQTGRFSKDEIDILLGWRDSFCAEHNISETEFNDLMTASLRKGNVNWLYNWIKKDDFMQQYYELLPYRNVRSMRRFRERFFQNVDNAPWTEADDKELRQLVEQLGTKWVEIGQMMGRTQDAVSQRWRHKLNYGKPAKMGEWTEDELQRLEEEVEAAAEAKSAHPDDEDLILPWHAISQKIGNGRTAQQCSNRWRINTTRRIKGKFVKIPLNDRIPGSHQKPPRTPSKIEKRLSGERRKPNKKSTAGSEEDGSFRSKSKVKVGEKGKAASKPRSQPSRASDTKYKSEERVVDSDSDETIEDAAAEKNTADVKERASDAEQFRSEGNGSGQEGSGSDDDDEESKSIDNESDSEAEQESEDEEQDRPVIQTSPLPTPRPAAQPQLQNCMGVTELSSSQPAPTFSSPPQGRKRSTPPSQQAPGSPSQPLPATAISPNASQSRSRNPFSKTAETPSHAPTASQLFAATQADSSATRKSTVRSGKQRDVVPESVVRGDRPSPSLSLRRRPVSSPLEMIEEPEDEDRIDMKSPTSFVPARSRSKSESKETSDGSGEDSNASGSDSDDETASSSGSGSGASSHSRSRSVSESNSASEPSDDESDEEEKQEPQSSFWQSINQGVRNFLPGASQQTQTQAPSAGASQKSTVRKSLLDALSMGGAVDDESEESSDDEW